MNVRVRDLVCIILGALLALVFQAKSSPELQLEYGQCRFGVERDGMFYNSDLPHRNYMTPHCGGLALASKFGASRWGWRFAYFASGTIQARENWARVVDGSAETGKPCDTSVTWVGCHARFDGVGYMYGFSLGLTYEQPLGWGFSAIPEVGLLHFRSVFKTDIRPADYQKPDYEPAEIHGVQDSGWSGTPAPYAGLMLSYSIAKAVRVYAGMRYYWPTDHRALSLTNHAITQIPFGLAVGF